MSRTPIEGFDRSNGHGRRQQGFHVVARQSNLIVESTKQVSHTDLKRLLIEQIKAADKPYGLFFDDIEGGFTFTQRTLPNAFNVLPTIVYRIYPDGKEELVRGVDLIGTPLIAFSKIVAADDQTAVFNGVCGAESGMGARFCHVAGAAYFADRSPAQRKIAGTSPIPAVTVGGIEMKNTTSSLAHARLLRIPRALVAFCFLIAAFAQAQDDVVMRAMKDELGRSVSQLQLQKMDKPYFLAYRMDEINQSTVSATLGSLTQVQPARMRLIGVEVAGGELRPRQ